MKSSITILMCALLLAACGKPDQQPDAGAGGGGGSGEQCTTFATAHDQFLNAPTTATIIKKTPTHPPIEGGLP